MTNQELKRLSKTVAVALRHEPQKFGLSPDAEGWVSIEALLQGIARATPALKAARPEHLQAMLDIADKKRYEILDGRIRAYYGHSRVEVEKELTCPPEFLWHGTTPEAMPHIRKGGLKPISRQHVHHSTEKETALRVAGRRTADQIILTVKAREAFEAGIPFHHGNEDTWLSGPVPAEFIVFED